MRLKIFLTILILLNFVLIDFAKADEPKEYEAYYQPHLMESAVNDINILIKYENNDTIWLTVRNPAIKKVLSMADVITELKNLKTGKGQAIVANVKWEKIEGFAEKLKECDVGHIIFVEGGSFTGIILREF